MKRILATAARFALAAIASVYASMLVFGAAVAAAGPAPYPMRTHLITGPAPATDVIVAALIAVAVVTIGTLLLVWADRAARRDAQAELTPVGALPPGRAAQQGARQARKAA
jgi:hypothetical protein